MVLTDDLAGSPQTINLTGNGIAGFFITSQTINPSITVFAGQSGSTQLNLGSSLGFAGAVNLSCSGAPANSTCTVSPNSVQLAANGTTPITISVTTAARATAGLPPQGGAPWPGTFAVLAASLLALVLSTFSAGRSRKVTFAGATLLALAFAGCGGGGGEQYASTGRGNAKRCFYHHGHWHVWHDHSVTGHFIKRELISSIHQQ